MSSSLLPEPVTPATTACGPSATRSTTPARRRHDADDRGEAAALCRGRVARAGRRARSAGRALAEMPEAALRARGELVGELDAPARARSPRRRRSSTSPARSIRAPAERVDGERHRAPRRMRRRRARAARCTMSASGGTGSPGPTSARRSPEPARRCGRRSAQAFSPRSGPTIRSSPGGSARHSCSASARCTAAATTGRADDRDARPSPARRPARRRAGPPGRAGPRHPDRPRRP